MRYKLTHDEVMARYGDKLMLVGRVPEALSGAMANQMYIANFETEEEVWNFFREVLEQ